MFLGNKSTLREVIIELLNGDLKEFIQQLFWSAAKTQLVTLEPDKAYILVLPESLPQDEVAAFVEALSQAKLKSKLFVVQADDVRVLEFD